MPLPSCRAQPWSEKAIPQIGAKSSGRRSSKGNKGYGKRRDRQDCLIAGLSRAPSGARMEASVFAGQPTASRAPCEPTPCQGGVLPAFGRAFELSYHFKHGASPRWRCRGGQAAHELRLKFLSSFFTGASRHKTSPWLKGAGKKSDIGTRRTRGIAVAGAGAR